MTQETRRWVEFVLFVLTAVLSAAAAYYNMDARVLLVETQIKMETASRIGLQGDMHTRIEKIDTKLERVGDKMDKLTEAIYERRIR